MIAWPDRPPSDDDIAAKRLIEQGVLEVRIGGVCRLGAPLHCDPATPPDAILQRRISEESQLHFAAISHLTTDEYMVRQRKSRKTRNKTLGF